MRITLRSVGGFTGPAGAATRSLDLDALPSAEASRIRALVAAADFFALPSKLMKRAPQSWDFVHRLEIEEKGTTHVVQFHDDAASEPLRALLASVSTHTKV